MRVIILMFFIASCTGKVTSENKKGEPDKEKVIKKTSSEIDDYIKITLDKDGNISKYIKQYNGKYYLQSYYQIKNEILDLDSSFFIMNERLAKNSYAMYVSYKSAKLDSAIVFFTYEKKLDSLIFYDNAFILNFPKDYVVEKNPVISIELFSHDQSFMAPDKTYVKFLFPLCLLQ